MLDLEVSSARKPAQHLETISFVARHQRSYTFHTFPYSRLTGQTSSLSFQAAISPDDAAPTAEGKGHDSWQPITKLQLTSLAGEQTIWLTACRAKGVIYPAYITASSPRRLRQTDLDDTAGLANDCPSCTYYLTDQNVNAI